MGMFDKNIYFYAQTLLLVVTPIPSSMAGGAVRLFNLHYSKGQSMEEGPFVGNCQRRQGPQAWSPRVKSAYLGCHLDMTGPQGQGRGVKLLTTLNVAPALLYYGRHAKWLMCIYYTSSFTPHPPKKQQLFFTFAVIHILHSCSQTGQLFMQCDIFWNYLKNWITCIAFEQKTQWFQHILVMTYVYKSHMWHSYVD